MGTPLSSRARLTDLGTLALFRDLFLFHGVAGARPAHLAAPVLNDLDRLLVAALVFPLLPADLFVAGPGVMGFTPRKPSIRQHLASLGIDPADEALVDVLLRVSQHYLDGDRRRKSGMRDLRAQVHTYQAIRGRQAGRCSTCGKWLPENSSSETLDHILPWWLAGDPPGGENWQIQCGPCNSTKKDWLSTLFVQESQNWVYGLRWPKIGVLSHGTRWVLLQQRGACQLCGALPTVTELKITRSATTYLPLADLLDVSCEICVARHGLEVLHL